MNRQLSIPFGISPGCVPYYCKYLGLAYEMCPRGSIFPIGEKEDCKACAGTCAGCVEMTINFGFSDFEDLKHLIVNPKILKPSYRERYDEYLKTVN